MREPISSTAHVRSIATELVSSLVPAHPYLGARVEPAPQLRHPLPYHGAEVARGAVVSCSIAWGPCPVSNLAVPSICRLRAATVAHGEVLARWPRRRRDVVAV